MWPADFTPCFTAPGSEPVCSRFEFAGEELILTLDNTLPGSDQLALSDAPQSEFNFGQIGGLNCRARCWSADTILPTGLQTINLRAAFGLIPDADWFLAARAKHLAAWDLASRYCGACGSPSQIAAGEPAKLCPVCAHRSYPQIAPAVMCLVRRGHELLLARSAHFRPGMYSALAGFVEAGESVEACVEREVFEETGIRVKNLRWFSSQPWPFPQSLMLAFHADYASGEITPQPEEIEDAQWFSLNNLPTLPAPVSIAARLIADGIRELNSSS